MRKSATWRTVTRLPTPEQLDRYQDWFDNDRKLKGLFAQLETLPIDTISDTEGWNHQRTDEAWPIAPDRVSDRRAMAAAVSAGVVNPW